MQQRCRSCNGVGTYSKQRCRLCSVATATRNIIGAIISVQSLRRNRIGSGAYLKRQRCVYWRRRRIGICGPLLFDPLRYRDRSPFTHSRWHRLLISLAVVIASFTLSALLRPHSNSPRLPQFPPFACVLRLSVPPFSRSYRYSFDDCILSFS